MRISIASAVAAALLAACGGGGGHTDVATAPGPVNFDGTDVPLAATQDADAAFAFVASVAATPGDSAEPITVGNATLAASDTAEPKPL